MHFFIRALATLTFLLSIPVSAQLGPIECIPYSIPIQSTITDCGPGLTGTKFRTTTKFCPSGEVKESTSYITSACQASTKDSSGTLTAEARCRITPGACAGTPGALVPADCPSGSKWSLTGSGVAHCVSEDPVCSWGTLLKHDFLGNPRCEQITCTSNQVIQSDGKSCGCSSGLYWTGSKCTAPTPPPPPSCPTSILTLNEPCCYGRKLYYRTTSCAGVVSGYWDMSSCNCQ